MNKLFRVQVVILFVGTAFAWFTVYSDLSRFYNYYGTLIRIKNCVIPNPVTTPCFYGAFAFLLGFIWSILLLRRKVEERSGKQRKLNILLIASTLFAWSNLTVEALRFYGAKAGPKISCSGVAADNIFLTACFIGSAIFLASLINSLVILRTSNKATQTSQPQ